MIYNDEYLIFADSQFQIPFFYVQSLFYNFTIFPTFNSFFLFFDFFFFLYILRICLFVYLFIIFFRIIDTDLFVFFVKSFFLPQCFLNLQL